MKIVYVSDAIYPYNKGGKEKRLYELSTRLAKLGHDVHIYTMHWWPTLETTRIEHGVTLHAISPLYPLYKNDKRSIKEGILFGLACLKLYRVTFDVLDVDHMPFFPIYSAWIVCLLRGEKLHGTWHEALNTSEWVSYMGKAGYVAAAIERMSIHLPHKIIAASEQTKLGLQTKHHRSKRVTTIASGVDGVVMKKLKPAKHKTDVLYVGRLVKDKNIDQLIRAVKVATQSQPNISCTIIGHGNEESTLDSLIKKLGISKNVHLFRPFSESADIYRQMKAAKVFVLPSVREGFGIVALESLGCGTPVVTTDSPGNAARHLITANKTGSVVPLNPTALAKAMLHWTKHSITQSSLTHINKYEWDNLAIQQEKAYAL